MACSFLFGMAINRLCNPAIILAEQIITTFKSKTRMKIKAYGAHRNFIFYSLFDAGQTFSTKPGTQFNGNDAFVEQ